VPSPRGVLRELDIGPDPQSGEVELTGTPIGAVVAGSIVALDGSVSQQHGQDVLQSLLLAQLAANPKASRHKDPLTWYKTYQSTLEETGWVASASTSFTRYLSPVSRYRISSVITDLFRGKTTPEELSLVSRTLSAFMRDQAAPAQFVWECPSHSGGIGNFQFGLATEEDNIVTLQLGRFAFEAPAHVTRLAFEEFGKDTKFLSSYVAMTLNEELFARLRNAIAEKLESRFSGSVAQVELTSG
jgi:hypothetical protein